MDQKWGGWKLKRSGGRSWAYQVPHCDQVAIVWWLVAQLPEASNRACIERAVSLLVEMVILKDSTHALSLYLR